jgi:S-sulfosulfanyl-L-cysteine sulfohydrolase
MSLTRREFLQLLAMASAAGMTLESGSTGADTRRRSRDMYDIPSYGNVSLLHISDCHAQLLPIYFREPSINIGLGKARGKPPHLVGENLLRYFRIRPNTRKAHAFTYLNFEEASRKYGKVGGFAHLATLVNKVRANRKGSLLLDSGDTWQGSATALWTRGQDMVDAQKLLGIEVMTGHWEFTYGQKRVKEIIDNDLKGHIDFVAQNVNDKEWGERIFKPYTMKIVNGVKVAVIGQAFPYTPIANNQYMFPDWSFGINDQDMQKAVNKARSEGAKVVVVLSHNGYDVDLKMASRVTGIDAILGGHTHDGVPYPSIVRNRRGRTLVINSGSNGKFLSVLDFNVRRGRVLGFRYRLLPVFSNMLAADPKMQRHINKVRRPYKRKLETKLATTESVLYRRGNFNGSFDQLILDAMLKVQGAEIGFSPGFRWGTSLLPGDAITVDRVMDQTAITYGTATLNELTGEFIKTILEDIADNLFHVDPYLQQGGDMVRVGGLKYTINPTRKIGKRISNMTLHGKPIQASRKYKVAGWASVQRQPEGKPQIWDVVSEYLRDKKTIKITKINVPRIIGIRNNPGLKYT